MEATLPDLWYMEHAQENPERNKKCYSPEKKKQAAKEAWEDGCMQTSAM